MRISVLIPSFNEEKSILYCLESVFNQSRLPDEVIVVDDGSTDNTFNLLKNYNKFIYILRLPQNQGNKSFAQEIGFQYVTGDVCVTIDADTILDYDFIKRVEVNFQDDKVDALAGYVKSIPLNWLTSLRQLDYLVAQDLHKRAQNAINAIYVIPGCAAAYKTSTFREVINFDHDTITEDLDFTYQLHEQGRKIVFDDKAIVYTLDPTTFSAYIKQLRRWYRGGWQNINKHKSKPISLARGLETCMVFSEGIVYPILALILTAIHPIYALYYLIAFFVFSLLLGLYGTVKLKSIDLLLYSPLYIFTYMVNSYLFVEQYVLILLRKDTNRWVSTKELNYSI